MKILLLTPPWYRMQEASLSHYPPGPTFVAGALEKAGYDAVVWNADYDPGIRSVVGGTNLLDTAELTRKHARYLENLHNSDHRVWQEVAGELRRFAPDLLGISAYSATYPAALEVARIAKAVLPNVLTVFGGVHPSIDPAAVASDPRVDVAVAGEGEITVVELVRALDHREDLAAVKGIAFRRGGTVVVTPPRPLAARLDDIVHVARHRLHGKERCPPSVFHMIYPSRGCPFPCVYCGSFNVWGRTKRSRGAEALLEEVARTHRDYGTRYFYLCDDIFFHPPDLPRAYAFCEGLLRRRIKVLWSTQTRAETIHPGIGDLLALMKRSGGQHVSIGIETGSDRIGKLIKKGNRVADARRAASLLRRHGLHLAGFFMFGFPWETEEEIGQTLALLKELDPPVAFPYLVTPAPGTELNRIALDLGLIPSDYACENFYHESPEMCLSREIPAERRSLVVNRTLRCFADHNRRQFRKSLWRRWRFYLALLRDQGIFRNPRLAGQYLGDFLPLHGSRRKTMDLAGKRVIITGASSGIGKSTARELFRQGADVYLVSRHREKLDEVRKEILPLRPAGRVECFAADLAREDEARQAMEAAITASGRIDVLINNAGIGLFGWAEETTRAGMEEVIATNLGSVFTCTRVLLPHFRKKGGGLVVNIASAVAYRGFPRMAIYSASKAAVKAFSEALRIEVARDNIGVLVFSPGKTATSFAQYARYEGADRYRHQEDRPGMSPDEVARLLVRAIRRGRREAVISREGLIFQWLGRISPTLLDLLIRKITGS